MFTGIVEEKGRIVKIIKGRINKLEIQSSLAVNVGESVSIQGICLTVIEKTKNGFLVEAMTQTKSRTTLEFWKTGDYVNLERALSFNGRVGGHIVLGHVDEVGRIVRIENNEYYIQIAPENEKFLISRGSIAIDGVSLTIGSISRNIFSVFLIPYTLEHTTLGLRKKGDAVNLEYDYLVKIVKSIQVGGK
ncbi:MAG: riboflavin synthase [candidate division WOR-3 bacterium]